MSMLAEPRSRQKWSHDPRNTNWSNDKNKFGYQMLTKMGWSEGNGLGADLSGSTSHIKVNKRGCNAGVGLKKSHEDDWIAHQDDFNSLLSALNGNPEKSDVTSSVENKMKASKHRYTKFVKSKDLSNASSDDLACIFGQRGKIASVVDEKSDGGESDGSVGGENGDLEIKTIESTLSMNEYFAKKMAALKQKQSGGCVEQTDNSINNVESKDIDTGIGVEVTDCTTQKKKKKKKKSSDVDDDESPLASPSLTSEVGHHGEVNLDPVSICKPERKKNKKVKKVETFEAEASAKSEPCEVDMNGEYEEELKKKKKSKTSSVEVECSDVVLENGLVKKKKKKKKNKPEVELTEHSIPSPCSESADVVLENGLVKKKKKKRKHAENASELVVDGVKKKKKKKDTEMV